MNVSLLRLASEVVGRCTKLLLRVVHLFGLRLHGVQEARKYNHGASGYFVENVKLVIAADLEFSSVVTFGVR